MLDRGGVYLASLYPSKGSEVGKTRPVLVLQTDFLNAIGHSTVIIVPLSTVIIEESYPLRFNIEKRDKLKQNSQLLCDQIRSIDIKRVAGEKLTQLSYEEMIGIEEQIQLILDFN